MRFLHADKGDFCTLDGIVLLLGLVMAYITIQKPESTAPRSPSATIDQFFENGREPTWLALFNPIAGAGAVLIGGLVIAGGGRTRVGRCDAVGRRCFG